MDIVKVVMPHKLREIDGKLRFIDSTALVPQVTLAEALNATCDVIYEMLRAKGKVTIQDIIEIPDWVFALAVELKWLPKPIDSDDLPTEEGRHWVGVGMTWLGYDLVDEEYREEFISLIHEKLNTFEPLDLDKDEQLAKVGDDPPNEQAPLPEVAQERGRRTAREVIDQWKDREGHTLETLAEQAQISIATLRRIRSEKLRYTQQRESLKAVASVIGCEWQDLMRHPR